MNPSNAPEIPDTMMAARLHVMGEPLQIDRIPVPRPRETDVLVEVKACGVVPNMRRVIDNFFGKGTTDRKLYPQLPAIFGLDPVGIVAQVGAHVTGVKPGQRVWANPARPCGACKLCNTGRSLDCPVISFQGYFGRSRVMMDAYPYGGFSQYVTAPAASLVRLPNSMPFHDAARLGYLGTAYGALKKIGVRPGEAVLINGISGTLGLCAAMLALAMGATRILGTGRNQVLLDRVKALAPDRIFVYTMEDMPATAPDAKTDPLWKWTREHTADLGVDGFIDCLPPGAPSSSMLRAIYTLRRGGKAVNVGAVMEDMPLNAFWLVANQITLQGSSWFSTADAQEIADMAGTGLLELSAFDHRTQPLSAINEMLASMPANKDGGFANFIVDTTTV